MMVVPWRFRSDGCEFSEEDWESLRTTIIHALHLNPIGLGGPLAHGTEWDDWFEDLLDAGGIGEKYWGESQGRGWIFPRDRTAIQPILRAQVVEMAGVERGKLKVVKAVETPNSDKVEGEPDPPMGITPGKEPYATKQDDGIADINPAVADPQRRGPGRPRKKLPAPGARSKKHVAIEESSSASAKRSRVSKGDETESLKTGVETVTNDTSSDKKNNNRPALVKTLRSPAATPTPTSGSPGLVFETRLTNSQKAKFIYANDTPSLSLFFKKVREKFQLRKEQKIDSIEVEIGAKVFVVDLNEERDWLSVIGAAEKSGDTGIGVIVGIV